MNSVNPFHLWQLPGAIAIGAVLLAPTALAEEFRVESPVESATVFASGALVTRVGRATISPGDHVMIFEALAPDFDEDTVRVTASGGGIRIGSVSAGTVELADAFAGRVRELRSRLQALRDSEQELNDRIHTAELQIKFLEGLSEGYAGEGSRQVATGQADAATWQQALDLIGGGTDDALARMRTARQALRPIVAEKAAVHREINDIGDLDSNQGEVRVNFSADAAGEVTVALTYLVEEAYWGPNYDARLDTANGSVTLSQFGFVAQETGEDWTNIRLTLATGNPAEEGEMDDVRSLYVDYVPDVQRGQFDIAAEPSSNEDLEEIIVTGSRIGREEFLSSIPAFAVSATVTGLATRYDIGGRVSLNGEDEGERFLITERSLDGNLVVRSAPFMEPRAYLYATFTHEDEDPLYGGEVSAFVDGVFTGTNYLGSVASGEDGEIAFGADDRVVVQHLPQGDREEESGIFNRQKVEIARNLIRVENFRPGAVDVEIYDRIPVSENEDIEVELMDDATPPDERDWQDEPGIFLWKRTLPAGGSTEILHYYRVSYPRDREVRYRQ